MFTKYATLSLLSFTLIIYSCASVGTPEGGPKDEEAPKLISSNPVNGAINVKTKELTLEFDEEIQVKDFNRQVLITPNLENPTQAFTKKQHLRIEFEKDLQPNTTYFINFREAVSDLTESNVPKNLSLTFSTGAFIDSGTVSGIVKDLFTNIPEKSINVVLYGATDTTSIRKHRPYYITQTDETGKFIFQNVRTGAYRLYAHADKNNNLIYDNEAEKISYLKTPIAINHATPPVDLITIKVDTRRPILEATEKYTDEFRINYNEGITSIRIVPLDNPTGPAPFVPIINKRGSTISLFPTTTPTPGKYLVAVTDSAANVKSDTVNVTFENKRANRNGDPVSIKSFGGQLTKTDPIEINFNIPVKVTDPQAITLVQDSTTRTPLTFPQDFKLNPDGTQITITQALKANKNLRIVLDTTKIVPVAGPRFRKNNPVFTITNKIQVGTLLGKVTTTYQKYWVEILTENYEVVMTLDSPKQLKLDRLEPAKYRIRVKIDENNDGQWQRGHADLKTPAEKIYHYPELIDIKANWEIEIAPPMPPLAF